MPSTGRSVTNSFNVGQANILKFVDFYPRVQIQDDGLSRNMLPPKSLTVDPLSEWADSLTFRELSRPRIRRLQSDKASTVVSIRAIGDTPQ